MNHLNDGGEHFWTFAVHPTDPKHMDIWDRNGRSVFCTTEFSPRELGQFFLEFAETLPEYRFMKLVELI